jgi:hypothetical protein
LQEQPTTIKKLTPPKRTFTWTLLDELLISVNMTSIVKLTNTRLVPPLSWLGSTFAKIKVLQQSSFSTEYDLNNKINQFFDSTSGNNRVIEIIVKKSFIEESLSSLRMAGFSTPDIFRMLDKGPWVLAFDIPKTLPRLTADLQVCWISIFV